MKRPPFFQSKNERISVGEGAKHHVAIGFFFVADCNSMEEVTLKCAPTKHVQPLQGMFCHEFKGLHPASTRKLRWSSTRANTRRQWEREDHFSNINWWTRKSSIDDKSAIKHTVRWKYPSFHFSFLTTDTVIIEILKLSFSARIL